NEDEKQDFSLSEVISNAIKMTKPIFKKNQISVLFDAKKEYMAVGFSNSLIQVILNIINNAKDALIENEIEDKKIYIDIVEDEYGIIINIKDNAGGIDESIIDKIFDPYFSTKQSKNGTGLGLYMSKMIIEEQMQWKLKVSNTENGALFQIVIDKKSV
ncbi:MAG: HAMP domain-containing sensor histidine kinase, partial [Campylobacterales bacterium]